MPFLIENVLKFPWRLFYGSLYCPWIRPYTKNKLENRFLTDCSGNSIDTKLLLSRLDKQFNLDRDFTSNEPIFILSTGWRTGSTLLQRLVMSDKDVLIWGEPYSDTRPIAAMLSHLRAFKPDYPYPGCFYTEKAHEETALSNQWIAYLFPSTQTLYEAHRSVFLKLFEQPSIEQGFKRWGIKDVRLDIHHAYYLKWLFPDSKFVFITRNPIDAYRSYKGSHWYIQWPHMPVTTALEFAAFWKHLAEGFLLHANDLDGLLIRYEDLANEETIQRLENFLSISIDRSVLRQRIQGTGKPEFKPQSDKIENFLIKRITAPIANQLGY